ncbi:MAG: SCO family protein [Planctomycetota bacterium]
MAIRFLPTPTRTPPPPRTFHRALWLLALACGVLALTPGDSHGQLNREKPAEMRDVGLTPRNNAQIPLDTPFIDSSGKRVTLGEVFDGTTPVLLTMNYSDCPMLCSLQLDGLLDGVKRMPWTMGQEYRMVTVSIDPKETPERAQMTKQKYLSGYGRAKSPDAWTFLVSPNEEDIRAVADAIGFHYKYVPDTRQYSHAAVVTVCTPDGRVSKYFGGVQYNPRDLKFALLEAAEGKVGDTWDQILLYCFHYDPEKNSYSLAAWKVMQFGAGLTVVVLGAALFALWRRDKSGRRPSVKTASAEPSAPSDASALSSESAPQDQD